MQKDSFTALLLEQGEVKLKSSIQMLSNEQLPSGDVTVRVKFSSLNYKDAMILNGRGKLVKSYPHIPGIDLAGVVESSENPEFAIGDEVLLTGWRVGEIHWGGFSQRARVKGDWLIKRPNNLTLQQTMAIGTPGFTAMLAVATLEKFGLSPDKGEVLVTGAAGGVGSVTVAILAQLGYHVAASTGRAIEHEYLTYLGAKTIIDRSELSDAPNRLLGSSRWAAAVDVLGGKPLATVLSEIKYGGSVATCGLAAASELNTTVYPFLLRAVNLLGIDSVLCPKETRIAIWNRISHQLPLEKLQTMIKQVGLKDVPSLAAKMLEGQVRGRTIIDVDDF
jgi:acrylyl-CoA reductase (NADPH)